MADSAASEIFKAIPSAVGSQPPVSTTTKFFPFHSASYETRSRVTPGVSSMIASREPMIRLTKVDFPTLGRPTITTRGKPINERCLRIFQMYSMVSDNVRLVESTTRASSAFLSGEVVRVLSSTSRSWSRSATFATPPLSKSIWRCSESLRIARALISASSHIFSWA